MLAKQKGSTAAATFEFAALFCPEVPEDKVSNHYVKVMT